MSDPADRTEFSLEMPFFIDTDGYTDRDREMFVCGVEFYMVYQAVKAGIGWKQAVHNENVSRIRMMCARLKVRMQFEPFDDEWTSLVIPART